MTDYDPDLTQRHWIPQVLPFNFNITSHVQHKSQNAHHQAAEKHDKGKIRGEQGTGT